MPESINLESDTTAARFLKVAIGRSGKQKDFNGKLLVKVELTVDGVAVPFEKAIEKLAEEFQHQVGMQAESLAVALVLDCGLSDAMKKMAEARMKVESAVKDVHARLRQADEYVERVKPL